MNIILFIKLEKGWICFLSSLEALTCTRSKRYIKDCQTTDQWIHSTQSLGRSKAIKTIENSKFNILRVVRDFNNIF